MIIWALAKKELRLLLRDRMAVIVLLGMPLVFILLWGLMLGENFGQKNADEKLRIYLVDQDEGQGLSAGVPWSKEVFRDLNETAGVRVEPVRSVGDAQQLIRKHQVAAVLVLKPGFSDRINRCSFLADADGINPFHRDGVYLDRIDAELLRDSKQPGAASIIDQVAQVSLLRVVLPWMISRAFERLSQPQFIALLGKSMVLPGPLGDVTLGQLLNTYSLGDPKRTEALRGKVGKGVQDALDELFVKYDLRGKTWAALTKSTDEKSEEASPPAEGVRWSGFGAERYQQLVPSFTVMFPFFLAMVVGWVFVTERRQGTLKRLRFAPVSRVEVLAGKLLPVFVLSMGLAAFLLLAGRLIFQMSWGPDDWPLWLQVLWLLPVVTATSFASMGLALLVAAVSRSEIQVALFGALPVLVMALVSGCILPREMMTESAQFLSWFTPHGWALAAYRELLGDDPKYVPDLGLVAQACGVLTAFGAGFLGLAWGLLRLD